MDILDDQENEILPVNSQINKRLLKFFNYQYLHGTSEEKTIPSIVNNIRELPCSIMKPYVLYYNNKCIKSDPYFNVIYTKSKYNSEVENLKTQYKMITKQKNYNIDRFEIYSKMQNLLNQDPDKYFNHDYNWYYNDGNIDVYNGYNYALLFHTENATNLCMSKLSKIHSIWQIENKIQLRENIDHDNLENTIFGIKSVLHNKNLTLGIRLWKKILLYNLKEFNSSNMKHNIFFAYSSDDPLSSFALNTNKNNELVTLDVAQNIKVWNIIQNTNKTLKLNKTDQCWGQIDYLNNNNIIYVNNNSYNVFDTRTGSCVIREENINLHIEYRNLYSNKDMLNSIYLTTQDSIYNIDLRKRCVVNKWTHLLKGNVFLSDGHHCADISKDLVCFASCDEKILIGQQNNQLILPKILPTVQETLEKNLTYKPLHMSHYLLHRFGFSTTGIKFLDHKNELSLVSINSVGDMFIYEIEKLANKKFQNEEKICNEKFSECGKRILDNIENTEKLNFISKIVINNLQSVLNNTPIDNANNQDINEKKRITRMEKIKRQLKKKIAFCKTNLSEVWELDATIDDIEELDTSAHVENWLSNINENSQSNPEFNIFDTSVTENIFDNSNQSFIGLENL